MRYELSSERPGATGVADQPYFATYDGEVSKSLFGKGTDDTHSTGSITTLKQCEAVSQLDTLPVRMAYAMQLPKISEIKIEALNLSSQTREIDGHSCVVLEQKNEGSIASTIALWVNPAKDYAIERYQLYVGDKVQMQVDISYEFKPGSGWLLSHWSSSRFGPDESLVTYSKTTVTQQEVNPQFEAHEFDIEFPVGTVVSDSRPIHKSKTGRTGTLDYVVLENGKTRPITWEDRHTSYEELIANATGGATQTKNVARHESRNWMGIVSIAVVVVAAILILVVAWLRRGTTRPVA